MYVDTEYLTLEWLNENAETSQRQLSKILGISLGSVNMMLTKMQRDGLIKIKNVSHNRVMYMLTPEGIAEKANKTIRYMVRNYKYINDMKERIKGYLQIKLESEEKIYLLVDDTEASQIVLLAANEIDCSGRIVVVKEVPDSVDGVLLLTAQGSCEVASKQARVEVVWERI